MSEVVQYEVQDRVALLTLNRPDRLNAWTGEMERAYFDALEDCATSESIRVIVLTGARWPRGSLLPLLLSGQLRPSAWARLRPRRAISPLPSNSKVLLAGA